jgi:8-oxo-dGTP pyrophosphatase MutT (NUDIX family)
MVGILGVFIVSLLFGSPPPPGAGVILLRTTTEGDEVLLVQNINTSRWSFTKGTHEPFDEDYRANAVREVWEEAGFTENIDYIVYSGPCFYGKRPYWFGHVQSSNLPALLPLEHRGINWFSLRTPLPKPNKDLRAWISQGAPRLCEDEYKFECENCHNEL